MDYTGQARRARPGPLTTTPPCLTAAVRRHPIPRLTLSAKTAGPTPI